MKYLFTTPHTNFALDNCIVMAIVAMKALGSVARDPAIKLLRTYYGAIGAGYTIGLKEAKDIVDYIFQYGQIDEQGSISMKVEVPAVTCTITNQW